MTLDQAKQWQQHPEALGFTFRATGETRSSRAMLVCRACACSTIPPGDHLHGPRHGLAPLSTPIDRLRQA